jgi:hypothetical protein
MIRSIGKSGIQKIWEYIWKIVGLAPITRFPDRLTTKIKYERF